MDAVKRGAVGGGARADYSASNTVTFFDGRRDEHDKITYADALDASRRAGADAERFDA